ncbi:MAG TPA: hypothetical protein VG426_07795 [Candidatus Dormibacteraeota bacterium]|jgi:hypothetical protein|nr:hypothetical protein [Candidatus Dormibacteraeota bacterium]
MSDLRLSDDGMYYWDGSQWMSTLSPDGRWRWNGSAWVPVTGMVAPVPGYQYYQQSAPSRVPTPWTRPMQYTVAAWYVLSGLYALSLPFWMSSYIGQIMTQTFQRQVALNPDVSPPPPDVITGVTNLMTGTLWVGAIIGVAICAVIVIGALQRWTWMFYVVLVLLGLGTVGLPLNLATAARGSSVMNFYNFPSWFTWISIGVGIPTAALFVWMLIGVIRYGPWAMARAPWPAATPTAAS